MGLQIAIAVLGQFREERLDAYVDCLEQFLQTSIPNNTAFPVSELFVVVVYCACCCCCCLLLLFIDCNEVYCSSSYIHNCPYL